MGAVRSRVFGWNVERLQLVEYGLQGAVWYAEEDTASHACEGPSESFEHRLPLYVVAELFEREIAIPITLDGQTLTVTFHNQINAPRADLPLWNDVVTGLDETLHDIASRARLAATLYRCLNICWSRK